MIIALVIVVSVIVFITGMSRCISGSFWPLPRRDRHELERPDYEKINRMELELGLAPSNYSAQGVDSVGMLVADADRRLKEAQRASDEIADQLEPERVVKREIAAAFASPAHVLGRSGKSVDQIADELEFETRKSLGPVSRQMADHIRETAKAVALATVSAPTVIQPMDEPYPVEICHPGGMNSGLPRLSTAERVTRLEALVATRNDFDTGGVGYFGTTGPPPGTMGFRSERGQTFLVLTDGSQILIGY